MKIYETKIKTKVTELSVTEMQKVFNARPDSIAIIKRRVSMLNYISELIINFHEKMTGNASGHIITVNGYKELKTVTLKRKNGDNVIFTANEFFHKLAELERTQELTIHISS